VTTTGFSWDAKDYAQHSTAQLQWANELLGKLICRGDESMLDIGCGDGKITATIARMLPHGGVTGLDASAEMIRLARESYPERKYPNLSFVQQDARTISLPEQFDLVFSTAALHWIREHDLVLRSIRGCLKPGGRILLQMGGRGNAAAVFASLRSVIATPEWSPYFTDFVPPYCFYAPEEYDAWLVQEGFRGDRVELIPKEMVHTVDGFRGWLRTTWFPYTDRLPVALRDRFLDELTAAYIADWPLDAAGNIRVQMVRLDVAAAVV
jgi:trans-aconitate methyltransferase